MRRGLTAARPALGTTRHFCAASSSSLDEASKTVKKWLQASMPATAPSGQSAEQTLFENYYRNPEPDVLFDAIKLAFAFDRVGFTGHDALPKSVFLGHALSSFGSDELLRFSTKLARWCSQQNIPEFSSKLDTVHRSMAVLDNSAGDTYLFELVDSLTRQLAPNTSTDVKSTAEDTEHATLEQAYAFSFFPPPELRQRLHVRHWPILATEPAAVVHNILSSQFPAFASTQLGFHMCRDMKLSELQSTETKPSRGHWSVRAHDPPPCVQPFTYQALSALSWQHMNALLAGFFASGDAAYVRRLVDVACVW